MKATFDLPDSLVKQVKLRALHDGRKLKEEVAYLLRAGLSAAKAPVRSEKRSRSPRVKIDRKTRLPVIVGSRKAPAQHMTVQQLNAMAYDTQLEEDLERLGLPH